VYDDVGTPLVGASMTFTNMNSSEVIYYTSTSGGEYQQDAANFVSGYYDSDIIRYYTVYGISTNTTLESINVTNGGTLLDICITIAPLPHLQNNTNYYISYDYIVGAYSQWGNITDATGDMALSSVGMIRVGVLIAIILSVLGVFVLPYITGRY